jgi:hypothetical protein
MDASPPSRRETSPSSGRGGHLSRRLGRSRTTFGFGRRSSELALYGGELAITAAHCNSLTALPDSRSFVRPDWVQRWASCAACWSWEE